MDHITQLATFKALEQTRSGRNSDLIDSVFTSPEMKERVGLVRIQFESSPDLRNELDQICDVFGISKREFLECALLDALEKAARVFGQIGRATGATPGTALYAFGSDEKENA